MSQRQVAEDLGWSSSKLIRIESGNVGISRTDLRALLDHYGVADDERRAVFAEIARRSRHQPWNAYRDVLKPEFVNFLRYEGSASRISQYHPQLLPGLLQTRAYAQAAIQTFAPPDTPQEVLRRQLAWRMERQQRHLEREDAPQMSFVLDEAALRRGIRAQPGDGGLWHEQMAHLEHMAQRPEITIDVLPLSYGLHLGLAGGFVILQFPDDEDDDLLYLENTHKSVAIQGDRAEIKRYREAFASMRDAAAQHATLTEVIKMIAGRI